MSLKFAKILVIGQILVKILAKSIYWFHQPICGCKYLGIFQIPKCSCIFLHCNEHKKILLFCELFATQFLACIGVQDVQLISNLSIYCLNFPLCIFQKMGTHFMEQSHTTTYNMHIQLQKKGIYNHRKQTLKKKGTCNYGKWEHRPTENKHIQLQKVDA